MPALTPDAWAQIRHDYEHTTRPVEAICLDHGISSNTLRDRVRRWGWTPRRPPIPRAGPAALVPRIEAAPLTCFTSPHWGEVGSQSDPGEGLQTLDNPRAPHPTPLPHSPSKTGVNALMGEREQTAIGVMAASNTRDDTEPSPHIAPAAEPAADDIPIGERLKGAVARVLPAIEAALGTLGAGPMRPRDMEQAARALGALMRTLRELNGLLDRHAAPEPERDIEDIRAELTRRIEGLIAAEEAEAPKRYLAAWEELAEPTNSDASC